MLTGLVSKNMVRRDNGDTWHWPLTPYIHTLESGPTDTCAYTWVHNANSSNCEFTVIKDIVERQKQKFNLNNKICREMQLLSWVVC